MAKTAVLSMHIDPQVKSDAENLFASFGMSLTEAAMREARDIASGEIEAKGYDCAAAMFDDILD